MTTPFPVLKRRCLDRYQETIMPMLTDGRPGHLWTGRLDLIGIIESIDNWMQENGSDLEAMTLRSEFAAMPHARYTPKQCRDALKEEASRWAGLTERGRVSP